MISASIIITLCVLILIAYIFDLSSSKTKIPSVILLLVLGWTGQGLSELLKLNIPNLEFLLPILGTLGLILIVLEGSLELELNKAKLPTIKKSFLLALVPMMLLSILFASIFRYALDYEFKQSFTNVIPLTIISSAIAIPSVYNLSKKNKEFVTYESSLSDILGVLMFNFFTLNEVINWSSFGIFFWDLFVMLVISLVATIGMSILLNKINHHIKYIPIIILVVLIYEISKIIHLPALIFILVLGLFLSNLDELRGFKWISWLKPNKLDHQVKLFKEIVVEGAFLIRSLFFILFGFLIKSSEVFNPHTIVWSLGIVIAIFIARYIMLRVLKLQVKPLIYIAPRGLITILLFLSIPIDDSISIINKSLVIQVILITSIVMMIGVMLDKSKESIAQLDENPLPKMPNEHFPEIFI